MAPLVDRALIPYRIRTVRIGSQTTALVLAILAPLALVSDHEDVPLLPFLALLACAGVGALITVKLPWVKLFATGAGFRWLYMWSAADIIVITTFIALIGPNEPNYFFLYLFTTIFFAASYPVRGQILLFVLTTVAYLGVWFAFNDGEPFSRALFRLAALGIVAFMASFLSRELMEQMAAHSMARRELEQEKTFHESLVQAQSDLGEGVCIANLETQQLEFVNDALCKMYGYTREELLALPSFFELMTPDEQERFTPRLESRLQGVRTSDHDEITVRRKDGTRLQVEVAHKPLDDKHVIVLVRDVTERTEWAREMERAHDAVLRADREKRLLLTHLVRAKEDERKRVASDIHDDSVQIMTSVAIGLERLARQLNDPQRSAVQRLEDAARGAVARLRAMVFELRPPTLDEEGLASALRLYLEEFQLDTEISYTFHNDLRGEPPYRTVLYRIAQEALTNVRKHSKASHVTVTLTESRGGVRLVVEDNGIGLTIRAADDSAVRHIGIAEMRERAEITGGKLNIRSDPAHGTVVEAWIPQPDEARPATATHSGVV